MAITFEEEKGFNKVIAAVLLLAAVLVVGGFLWWKMFTISPSGIPAAENNKIKMNLEVLNDPRVKTVELYPEIPAPTVAGGRVNPFVENGDKTYVVSEPNVSSGNPAADSTEKSVEAAADKTEDGGQIKN